MKRQHKSKRVTRSKTTSIHRPSTTTTIPTSLASIQHVPRHQHSIQHHTISHRGLTTASPSRGGVSHMATRRSFSMTTASSQPSITPHIQQTPSYTHQRAHFSQKPSTPKKAVAPPNTAGDESDVELEIIKASPSMKAVKTPDPSQITRPAAPTVAYNAAIPNFPIKEDGVCIFTTSNKYRHRVATGAVYGTTLTSAGITAASYAFDWFPLSGILSGVVITLFASLMSYQAHKTANKIVNAMYLMPDNTLDIETVGSLGVQRRVNYPVNSLYPILADQRIHLFGAPIKFLPLPEDLTQKPGTMPINLNNLYIHPASNVVSGAPAQAFQHLCLENTDFRIVDKKTSQSGKLKPQSRLVDH